MQFLKKTISELIPINLILIGIISLLLLAFPINATTQHSFQINFNDKDFNLIENQDGTTIITYNNEFSFPNPGNPAIPVIASSFIIEGTQQYESSYCTIKKRLIKSNIILADAPIIVPSNDNEISSDPANNITYSNLVYPDIACQYSSSSQYDGCSVLHFLSYPFIYDATKKQLYFVENIAVSVSCSDINDCSNLKPLTFRDKEYLKKIVLNPEKINLLKTYTSTITYSGGESNRIQYLIITADSLKNAFKPLVKWKKTKGVNSHIISVEEVAKLYSEGDLQLKIKNYLCNLYYNNGLIYALFGGDNSIIPVRGCYGKCLREGSSYAIDNEIPTDLYYGCFSGNFSWDKNNNNIYGEIEDEINLYSQVIVSRLPIRTSEDVTNTINKIIEYETNPKWNNNILMGGVKLYGEDNGRSDSEIQGELLYNNYIYPYWDGKKDKFYDTYTDFNGQENYDVTANNLFTLLNEGYSLIDFNTHGNKTSWAMEKGRNYSVSDALNQAKDIHSLILTGACLSNAFDSQEPSLSESIIRNPNNGVIGYLGSSRYGWTTSSFSKTLGPSLEYESIFYRYLFDQSNEDKNLGLILQQTKNYMVKWCGYYASQRWLMFSLNLIGDPETPIYTSIPKYFTTITLDDSNGKLTINTGVKGCRICVSSIDDNGESYYLVENNTDQCILDTLPDNFKICITKQGYVPYQLSLALIQNETINGTKEYVVDYIKMGANVTTTKPSGRVTIKNADIKIKGKEIIIDKGVCIEKGSKISITN